jgi:hypothetical protein
MGVPALPSYPSTNSVFIETTELAHEHGGAGWDFGTCLWSPTANASGHRVYELMLNPLEGDLVIHILKDFDDGEATRSHFTGFSYVSSPAGTGARPDWMEAFARTIDAAKKYVVSSTLKSDRVDWNAERVRGGLAKAVQQLKREPDKGLFMGGVKLPMALAELGTAKLKCAAVPTTISANLMVSISV